MPHRNLNPLDPPRRLLPRTQTRCFFKLETIWIDIDPASRLAFEAGSIPFTSQGAALDRNALATEAGLDWRFSGAVTLGIAYIGQVGPRDSDNGVKGRIEVKF